VAAVPGRVGLPAQARGHAASLAPIIARLDPDGSLSLRSLAAKLTAEGLPTPAGAAVWTAAGAGRGAVKARLGVRPPKTPALKADNTRVTSGCLVLH
jgi:hypothetical protein